MIFTSSGSVYSKVQFKTEEEVEKVVIDNFKLLFGDYSILLPKFLIRTSGGKGTIPDGIIIDFKGNRWFIMEVERGVHDTWEHITKQIGKQFVAVMNREMKNKITELCIAEIGKQKEFSKLLESDLKIQLIHIHGYVQKILEKDPVISLPIDYTLSDLEVWAKKFNVQIQHVEKYMNSKGEVLYDFPDLELTQEKESLKTTDKSNALYEIVKAGLLNVGDIVHFDYGPKGKPKTHFEGKICSDGIEVDGIVSSASVSALRCIQQISPSRTTTNGWVTWKTADGKFLEEKWNALLKVGDEQEKSSNHKKGKNKKSRVPSAKIDNDDNLLYHFAKGGEIIAMVKRVGSRFVLLAESKLSLKYDFRGSGWLNVRKNASISADGTLRKDIECDSPSMAAALVAGGARNGLTFWKNKDRKMLKNLK
ncbi:MAG: DUF4357 domain-containing protein [Fibrobacter sp.]|nr:DUF4357 domain-containing protein [Fibrobacter sp.]